VVGVSFFIIKDAATPSVLTRWTGEAAELRLAVPPVRKLDGTSLPVGGRTHATRVSGIGTGAALMVDQVQGTVVVDRGFDVPGIPPRGRPVRC
jgi:hypothetical protein